MVVLHSACYVKYNHQMIYCITLGLMSSISNRLRRMSVSGKQESSDIKRGMLSPEECKQHMNSTVYEYRKLQHSCILYL